MNNEPFVHRRPGDVLTGAVRNPDLAMADFVSDSLSQPPRADMETIRRRVRELTAPNPDLSMADIDPPLLPACTGDAVDRDARLKACGLVWHEAQLSGTRWVAPAGFHIPANSRVKVLPLYMVQPVPGLEIEALDGEKYILPPDFKGDWFAVVSPKGVRLIA